MYFSSAVFPTTSQGPIVRNLLWESGDKIALGKFNFGNQPIMNPIKTS